MATRIHKSGYKNRINVSKRTRKNNLKCQRQAHLAGTQPLINPDGIKIISGSDMVKDGKKIRKIKRTLAKMDPPSARSTSLSSESNRKKLKRLNNMASCHAVAVAEAKRGEKRASEGGQQPETTRRTVLRRKIRRVNVNSLCYITMMRMVRPEGEEREKPANLEGGGNNSEEEMEVQTVFEDYETFRGDADIGLTQQLDAHARSHPGVCASRQSIPAELVEAADRVRDAPAGTNVTRTEKILKDGTRCIEELQNVHLQTVMIGLDFFSVKISPDAFEWAQQKSIHTNDLSRGVAALIRNASTSAMTVFGIDYNSMRKALGLGPTEIHNILKRALPFSLGIPESLMSMWQVSLTRYRIRVIPIWVMVSFLSNLPKHIHTLNDNPLKTTLTAYNQMLGLRHENIGAHKFSMARYLKILEYAIHQYEDELQKLAADGVLRTDEYGKLFSDVKVSILNLQSTSETAFIETELLRDRIDSLERRLDDQQKLIDDLRLTKENSMQKMSDYKERLKRELRAELFEEFRKMFEESGRGRTIQREGTRPLTFLPPKNFIHTQSANGAPGSNSYLYTTRQEPPTRTSNKVIRRPQPAASHLFYSNDCGL